jgi:hypothetical protein
LHSPSVVQCIRAIGFIFEHMLREDSYREPSEDYDFSAPARMDLDGGADGESDDVAQVRHSTQKSLLSSRCWRL